MNTDGPSQLGDYRIVSPIGAGGMGEVYLAEHVHLRKRYAVKVLPRALAGDQSFVHRFFDEARVMADLKHPHIVPVHAMGEQDGTYFLVMDYVTGPNGEPESLHDRLKATPEGRLPEADVRKWATQVAEALEYAHERGVVHRDLKPANILVDSRGNVKLSDFGVAKAIGHEFILSQIHQTMRTLGNQPTVHVKAKYAGASPAAVSSEQSSCTSGASGILGTYDYLAPEQRGDYGGDIDERTDVYAFGVVLYRLLTGRRLCGMAEAPSKLVSTITPRWDAIIARCTDEDPAGRYASMQELIAEFHGLRTRAGQRARRSLVRLAFGLALIAGWGLFLSHYYWNHFAWTSVTSLRDSTSELETLLSSALSQGRAAEADAEAAKVRAAAATRERDIAQTQLAKAERARDEAETHAQQALERAAEADRARVAAKAAAHDAEEQRKNAEARQTEAERARAEAVRAAQQARQSRDDAQTKTREAERARAQAISRAEQAERLARDREQALNTLRTMAQNRRGFVLFVNDTPVELSYQIRWQVWDGSWTAWSPTRVKTGHSQGHWCTAPASCEIQFDYTATDSVTYDPKKYWLEYIMMPATVKPKPELGRRYRFVYDTRTRHIDLVKQ